MSELSPKTQELIREGRNALRPSDADRERVLAALQARLGPLPAPGDAGVAPAAGGSRALWMYVSAGLIGLGVLGGAVSVALRSPKPGTAVPPAPALSVTGPAPAAAPGPSGQAAAPATKSLPPDSSAVGPTPAPPSAAGPRSAPEGLAQEVLILSRAAKELRSGRAADALGTLNEHQAKFPKGALSEERRAAKTEALCALGRFTEARAELGQILRRSPHSALGARARDTCKARSPRF